MPNPFGGGLPGIRGIGYDAYGTENAELMRKQKLAEMLMQQGLQAPQQQKAGRFVVPTTPLQSLAQIGSGVGGAYLQNKTGEEAKMLAQRQQSERAQALSRALQQAQGSPQPAPELGGGPAMPADPVGAMGTLAQSQDPVAMQFGAPAINMQQQQMRAQQEQQFRAQEGAANREAQAAKAEEDRRARALENETARQYRLAQEERDRAFRQQESAENRRFRTEERRQSQDFQAQQAEQAAELRRVLAESARQNKPLTEFQGRNVLFGSRMASADKTMLELEDKISTTGLAVKQSAQNIPIIGGVLGAAGNVALSGNQQRVEQAQRDFVNAVLRQESGAVINPDEFANATKQYFPAPGDSKEVIAQKKQNRKIAIAAFKALAGPGADQIDLLVGTPRMPGAPAGGTSPKVIDFSELP